MKKLDPVALSLLVLVILLAVLAGILRAALRLAAFFVVAIALALLVVGGVKKSIYFKEPAQALQKGVTAVVLNHNRPHNVKECVESLSKEPLVLKVILMNGKPDTRVSIEQADVVTLDDFENNKVYGGARRFLVDSALIETDAVLFIDDDKAVRPGQVKSMYDAIEGGELLVGPACRQCDAKGYVTDSKTPDTVLTSTMMLPRSVFVDYQRAFQTQYKELLKKTHGNGEDLSMNHFVRSTYNKLPRCMPLDVKDLDVSGGYSSQSSHYEKRAEICRQLFATRS